MSLCNLKTDKGTKVVSFQCTKDLHSPFPHPRAPETHSEDKARLHHARRKTEFHSAFPMGTLFSMSGLFKQRIVITVANAFMALTISRVCSKDFAYITSFNLYNNSMR